MTKDGGSPLFPKQLLDIDTSALCMNEYKTWIHQAYRIYHQDLSNLRNYLFCICGDEAPYSRSEDRFEELALLSTEVLLCQPDKNFLAFDYELN